MIERILLIDDHPRVLSSEKELLEHEKVDGERIYQVETASSVNSAIRLAEERLSAGQAFTTYISDGRYPLNGTGIIESDAWKQTLYALRELHTRYGITFNFVVSSGSSDLESEFKKEGIIYFPKYRFIDLLDYLRLQRTSCT